MKYLATKIFAWIFLQLPIQKNIIATLRIVSIENSELTLLLTLYFYALTFKPIHRYRRILFNKNRCIIDTLTIGCGS